MKTATLPSLRVAPELRKAAEAVLQEGETLSSFVEESVRRQVEFRYAQQAFIARGLASAEAAQKSGKYVSAEDVLTKLAKRLEQARKTKPKRSVRAK
ncbi:MAG: prevent-host-death protein [Rhodocyclaceae bacterium]|nr:prevent-host-death protein [Rhodocyclaceae bacterium]